MESNKNIKIKDLLFIFLPLLIMFIIQYGVEIIDIIIIFISNLLSDEKSPDAISIELIMSRDYNQPMNIAYITLAKYILYIVVFGIWIRKISSSIERKRIVRCPNIPAISFLMLCGWAGQIFVDCILVLARPHFPNAFAEYDKMVSGVSGASVSFVLLFAVCFAAPIGEEILFRGLIQKYTLIFFNKLMNKIAVICTILFQALLFGIYHGNIIQGIYAFVMGILLGFLAAKFGSLIPGIIFHIAINVSIYFVPNLFFKTTLTTVISCIISFICLIGCVIMALWLDRRHKHS